MINGGIFGPKLSGKTTLAKHLSREYWNQKRIRSLVFDVHNESDWGPQAWVTPNKEEYWPTIWRLKDCIVIVDEAAVTINRNNDLNSVFTMLRHNRHRLLIIGHSGRELTLGMRQNLDTIFLFRQPEKVAEIWAETFAQKGLLAASDLQRYEFIQCSTYGTPVKNKLQM